ncbi:hypothetical protein N657DRAFT_568055, partial [Parathielavia appendiculata]
PLSLEGYQFVIGQNLDASLRRLRFETSTTTVWADAVCINQEDTDEKLRQLKLMAKSMPAPAQCFSGWAKPPFTRLQALRSSYLAGHDTFDEKSPWERMPDNETIQGLQDILQRSYPSRIWVVQEAALSRHIRMQVSDLSMEW